MQTPNIIPAHPEAPPDLTPRPVPAWNAVARDIAVAEVFLRHIAASPEDSRHDRACRLLVRDAQTGRTLLDDIAHLAHATACAPLEAPLDQIKALRSEIWELIYEYSEDCGAHASPLYFTRPTPLLEVLEFANIWRGLVTEPITGFSTRDLARLACVDIDVMEQQLWLDGFSYQSYGISLSEMAEMTVADQLFWYRQEFVIGLEDVAGWLAKFPGFTPPNAEEPVVSPPATPA